MIYQSILDHPILYMVMPSNQFRFSLQLFYFRLLLQARDWAVGRVWTLCVPLPEQSLLPWGEGFVRLTILAPTVEHISTHMFIRLFVITCHIMWTYITKMAASFLWAKDPKGSQGSSFEAIGSGYDGDREQPLKTFELTTSSLGNHWGWDAAMGMGSCKVSIPWFFGLEDFEGFYTITLYKEKWVCSLSALLVMLQQKSDHIINS